MRWRRLLLILLILIRVRVVAHHARTAAGPASFERGQEQPAGGGIGGLRRERLG